MTWYCSQGTQWIRWLSARHTVASPLRLAVGGRWKCHGSGAKSSEPSSNFTFLNSFLLLLTSSTSYSPCLSHSFRIEAFSSWLFLVFHLPGWATVLFCSPAFQIFRTINLVFIFINMYIWYIQKLINLTQNASWNSYFGKDGRKKCREDDQLWWFSQ